jgi:hypothetical protein
VWFSGTESFSQAYQCYWGQNALTNLSEQSEKVKGDWWNESKTRLSGAFKLGGNFLGRAPEF